MAKVLLVDDDRNIVEILKLLLTREGHEVFIAHDGQSGLAMAKAEHPALIVLDVMMPEMDGFSVSGELFKDPEMRKIPILILTAKGNTQDIFSLVPNVSLCMNKPFDPPDFVANVKKLVPSQK